MRERERESQSRNHWGLKKFDKNLEYSPRQLYMLGATVSDIDPHRWYTFLDR